MHKINTNGGVQNQMAAKERKLDMIVKAMTAQNVSPIHQAVQNHVCAICSDVNPVKNNETQQRKGTQDRSMDRFEGMTSTRCL
jgi:hypothetical protein